MLRLATWALAASLGTASGIIGMDANDIINLTNYASMRAARTGITTVKIILDYKWSLRKLNIESSEYAEAKSQAHTRSAHRLLNLCWRNRGTFIKVGQHLGGMDYLLPWEYTQVLKVLHSDAPQSTLQEIEQVVKEELNVQSLDELFCDFSDKPLGTASLAQVHKARLKQNGAVVAVKVQHPNVRELANVDMNMMDVAVRLVKWVFPEFELMWLSEETRSNLPIELDFRIEASNCAIAAQNLKCFNWVKLPEIYWKFSTPRIMVMEFLEGGQVNDRKYLNEHSIDFNDVGRLLAKIFSEMIFVHGFVHSDPHPGNILIRKRPASSTSCLHRIIRWLKRSHNDLEVMLLDHGLYRRLSKKFRYQYASLWQAIINRDLKAMEKHAREIGGGDLYPILVTIVTGRAWKVVGEEGVQNVKFSKDEDDAIRSGAGMFLPHISQVLSRIPREMLLVLKANDHLRGLEHMFGVRGHQSGFLDMSRCCLRALCDLELELSPPSKKTLLFRLDCQFQLRLGLALISAYEWYMWMQDLIARIRQSLKSKPALPSVYIANKSSSYDGKVFVPPDT